MAAAVLAGSLGLAAAAHANLLRNPSFETVPDNSQGQSLMPSDWQIVHESPDTYSNDGSYGLNPADFGNFTGVTAQNGIRWVAAWSSVAEDFGQQLTTPLTAGVSYTLSGYLIQAKRGDLDNPGGYNVYLSPTATFAASPGSSLGTLGPTTNSDNWEFFSVTFAAPANAGSLPFLYFQPYGVGDASAYPGLDNLTLELTAASVPEGSVAGVNWLALSFLAAFGWRERRQRASAARGLSSRSNGIAAWGFARAAAADQRIIPASTMRLSSALRRATTSGLAR